MAVLGGREKKKKIESNDHLVAAFPTRRYDRRQAAGSATRQKASSSVLAKLSRNSEMWSKKLVLS